MSVMKENDTFVLSKTTEATVIGERRMVLLPAGTQVTVVVVFGDSNAPVAYEVEAYLPRENLYATATVEVRDVV